MKAQFKTGAGKLLVELQGETTKDLFAQLAAVQEVFEAETSCGCCQGTEIRYVHRVVDDFHFYELRCGNKECRARFAFGQAKKGGGLFPKRKGEDGKYLPFRGWERYDTKKQQTAGGGSAAGHSSGQGWAPGDPTDDDVPF